LDLQNNYVEHLSANADEKACF